MFFKVLKINLMATIFFLLKNSSYDSFYSIFPDQTPSRFYLPDYPPNCMFSFYQKKSNKTEHSKTKQNEKTMKSVLFWPTTPEYEVYLGVWLIYQRTSTGEK